MTKLGKNTHVFIVRIWWERRNSELQPDLWRGKVEYLNQRAEKFFSTFHDLIAFIEAQTYSDNHKSTHHSLEPLYKKLLRWLKRLRMN